MMVVVQADVVVVMVLAVILRCSRKLMGSLAFHFRKSVP